MRSIKQIEKAFQSPNIYDKNFRPDNVKVWKDPNGSIRIKLTSMYDAPRFRVKSLLGLVQLFEKLTGCTNFDVVEEIYKPGCESCDYGSSYGKVYKVW